jgi:hypothetical protein
MASYNNCIINYFAFKDEYYIFVLLVKARLHYGENHAKLVGFEEWERNILHVKIRKLAIYNNCIINYMAFKDKYYIFMLLVKACLHYGKNHAKLVVFEEREKIFCI